MLRTLSRFLRAMPPSQSQGSTAASIARHMGERAHTVSQHAETLCGLGLVQSDAVRGELVWCCTPEGDAEADALRMADRADLTSDEPQPHDVRPALHSSIDDEADEPTELESVATMRDMG